MKVARLLTGYLRASKTYVKMETEIKRDIHTERKITLGGSCIAFSAPASVVMKYHFLRLLFIRSKSLRAAIFKEWKISTPLERKVSKNLQVCFILFIYLFKFYFPI